VGVISGVLQNLPLEIGRATGDPYIGFAHPYPNKILAFIESALLMSNVKSKRGPLDESALRWMRRTRVSHMVAYREMSREFGEELDRLADPALDRIVYHQPQEAATRQWSIFRVPDPYPEARLPARARTMSDRLELLKQLTAADNLDTAFFLAEDGVPARPDVRSARLVSWDGVTATVEHSGPCDLVLARTFDSGWTARIDDGPEEAVLQVDAGFQAVRIGGSGMHVVKLSYLPRHFFLWAGISAVAGVFAIGTLTTLLAGMARRTGSKVVLARAG
jgi:hypothetical protein